MSSGPTFFVQELKKYGISAKLCTWQEFQDIRRKPEILDLFLNWNVEDDIELIANTLSSGETVWIYRLELRDVDLRQVLYKVEP